MSFLYEHLNDMRVGTFQHYKSFKIQGVEAMASNYTEAHQLDRYDTRAQKSVE